MADLIQDSWAPEPHSVGLSGFWLLFPPTDFASWLNQRPDRKLRVGQNQINFCRKREGKLVVTGIV